MRNIYKMLLVHFEHMVYPETAGVDDMRPGAPCIRCKCCAAVSNSIPRIKHGKACPVGKAMTEYGKLYAARKQKAVASIEFECQPSFNNFGKVMREEQTLKITFPDGGSTTFHGRCSNFIPGVAKTKVLPKPRTGRCSHV